MRYTVSHDMNPGGELTRETDVQIMVIDQMTDFTIIRGS